MEQVNGYDLGRGAATQDRRYSKDIYKYIKYKYIYVHAGTESKTFIYIISRVIPPRASA
jgi:hypothetical protein